MPRRGSGKNASNGVSEPPAAMDPLRPAAPLQVLRRRLLNTLLPLLAAAALLSGLAVAGRLLREQLRDQDRYALPFAEIACDPPPGMDRATFLDEVQYLAGQPDRLRLLEDGLSERLAAAFTRHPWVEQVEGVRVTRGQVRVSLIYRTPVLAVRHAGALRVVDRHGVLLPPSANGEGLPVYPGKAPAPAGAAGARWGDPGVETAARAAARRPLE